MSEDSVARHGLSRFAGKPRVRVQCNDNGGVCELTYFNGFVDDVVTQYKSQSELPDWVKKSIAVLRIVESQSVSDIGMRIKSRENGDDVYWLVIKEEQSNE